MRTAHDLLEEMTRAAHDPYHELREVLSPELAGKLTSGKAKDWPTHAKYLAGTLGVPSLKDVNLHDLTHDVDANIDRYLKEAGRGDAVRRNTKNTFRLIRAVGVAKGLLLPEQGKYESPKRNRLTKTIDGKPVSLRPPLRKNYQPYAIRYETFNSTLRREVDDLKHFYTSRIVRGRNRKAIYSSTWGAHLNRLERFFGAMSLLGFPHEAATLKDFVNPDYLERFAEHFLEEHDDVSTYTLKDLLSWAHNVAKNFFKDKALADEISGLLNQMRYVRVKDQDDIVMKISAEDLYTLGDKLFQHARAYDRRHYHRKPCDAIKYPQAMTAWHYGRALAIALANCCWFRRSNLFNIVWGTHLYYYQDKLYFKFSADEMKSKEPHMGMVVDLWRGQTGYNQLVQLLERYRETRHHLVDKFKQNNPDKPEPKQFLLNINGAPYAANGGWAMFSSVSRAFLGADKEVFPHAPRLIVPTYLMLEYDYAILGSIQAILDHKSILTTERHYLRMKRLMTGQFAQRVMDERMAKDQQAQRLAKMERMLFEIRSQFAESSSGGQSKVLAD